MADEPELKAVLSQRSVAIAMATVAAKTMMKKKPLNWALNNVADYMDAAKSVIETLGEKEGD